MELQRGGSQLGRADGSMNGALASSGATDLAELQRQIAAFKPFNEQEEADQRLMLAALEDEMARLDAAHPGHASDGDAVLADGAGIMAPSCSAASRGATTALAVPSCLTRDAQAHFTCSIWAVNPFFTKTLMVYHNIYDSWSWIGGHADGCADLASVALRELEEETGVAHARIIPVGQREGSSESPLLSLEVLTVNGHEKRGSYVSSHLHLNVTYLAVADEADALRVKPDENSGVAWVPLNEVVARSSEPWIRTRIYQKILDRLKRLG